MPGDTVQVGCVVRLKSGGPPMTANRADGDSWECLWFAGDEILSALIAGEALEPGFGPRGPKPVITPCSAGEDKEPAGL